MLSLYVAGRLRPVVQPVVQRFFPLRDAPADHRRRDQGQQVCRIVLIP